MAISKKQWQELNEMIGRDMSPIVIDSIDNHFKRCLNNYLEFNNLKGKKMEQVFEVTVVQRDSETGKLTTLVPITVVLATCTEDAKTKTLITYARDCKTEEGVREGIDVLVRPFC